MPKSAPDPVTRELIEKHGEFLSGDPLRSTLGYRSKRTFYRAAAAGTTPVRLIKLPGQNTWLARTRDVGAWLARVGAAPPKKPKKK